MGPETCKGRRLPDGGHPSIAPGDYWKDDDGVWWCYPPGEGHGAGMLTDHTVEEHEDGTITVRPSILMTGRNAYHGFLERGVWREA